MINHNRRKHLLKVLAERQSATVSELEGLLGASAATVRRDISVLAEGRLLKKVHGGARHLPQDHPAQLVGVNFNANVQQAPERKRNIGRRAVALCNEGDTIIINGGSTTFAMAEFLTDRRLTILTNSFLLAQRLLAESRNDVLVPGGKIYREQNVIVSPFENDVIQNHYASKMFIGAIAVSPLGLLESDPLLVRAELKLIKQAEDLIVLVDSSKFTSKSAGLIVCPLSRVRTLITDEGVSGLAVQQLRSQGIDVIVVPDR